MTKASGLHIDPNFINKFTNAPIKQTKQTKQNIRPKQPRTLEENEEVEIQQTKKAKVTKHRKEDMLTVVQLKELGVGDIVDVWWETNNWCEATVTKAPRCHQRAN